MFGDTDELLLRPPRGQPMGVGGPLLDHLAETTMEDLVKQTDIRGQQLLGQ